MRRPPTHLSRWCRAPAAALLLLAASAAGSAPPDGETDPAAGSTAPAAGPGDAPSAAGSGEREARAAAANASRLLTDAARGLEPPAAETPPPATSAPSSPPTEAAAAPPGTAPAVAEAVAAGDGGAALERRRDAAESRSLGRANGPLSARPLEHSEAPSILDNPLAALDPRVSEIARIGGAIALVLGLVLLTRVALRRATGVLGGGLRPAGVLEILARYPIARGQSLVILQLGQRILLVHQADSGMQTLSEVTDREEVARLLARMEAGSRTRDAGRFRATLARFEREHERLAAPDVPSSRGVEVVDLTRRRRGALSRLLGGRAAA